MRPDVVTFWHGPLDRLRQLCLRSQVAVGHKVTVYSFDPLAGLPDRVGNAAPAASLAPRPSEKLRPTGPRRAPRHSCQVLFRALLLMTATGRYGKLPVQR